MADEVPSELLHVLEGHKGAVLNCKFNSDGRYCISCGQDRSLRLWNPRTGTHIKEYSGPHNHEVNDVATFIDNSRFVSVGGDKAAFLWDVATGRVIRKFTGHDERLYCCQLSADDQILFTGSYDKKLKIWDLRSSMYRPIQTLSEARDAISCVAVRGPSITTGSVDGCVRTYDIRSGNLSTDEVFTPVLSVEESKDNSAYLISCLDSSIRMLDSRTGAQLNVFKGHKAGNYRLNSVFDFEEQRVVSGSEDGRLCIWDVCSSSPLQMTEQRIQGNAHNGAAVFCVRMSICSAEGQTTNPVMVTCGNDRCLRVWGVSSG